MKSSLPRATQNKGLNLSLKHVVRASFQRSLFIMLTYKNKEGGQKGSEVRL